MNPSARHRLLDDTLFPVGLDDSLRATRGAARRRRVTRRTLRAAGAAAVVIAAAWLCHPVGDKKSPLLPVATSRPERGFLLVTSAAAEAPTLVHTVAAPAGLIVSSRPATTPLLRVTEDDLFALAGSRPAALHRLADGSAHWMWLDEPQRW